MAAGTLLAESSSTADCARCSAMVRTDLEEVEGGGARAAALARGGEPRERLESSSAPLGELGSWLERLGREDLRRPSVGDAVGEND